jgi:Protein of unknown function (DUF1592)/Protein of unknown function (DUF1588)/Protein of unknown function (DUF1595)/Protein of unknown function (DUF1587)/Protein of unknown function (DUF1585)
MKLLGRAFGQGARWFMIAPWVLSMACTGEIGPSDFGAPGSQMGSKAPGGGPASAGGATSSVSCTSPSPGPSPLRRLTHREYDNTIRQLLGDTSDPAKAFAPEEEAFGFDNSAEARGVTSLLAEQYMNAAEQLATNAAKDLPKLMGCDPAATAGDACVSQFIQTFGKRAFRRPVRPEEQKRFADLFATGRTKYGTTMGVQLMLQAILQSPNFLYRVELGSAAASGTRVAALDPWETASRLSYLLWASMPDEELLRAAESGQLSTREQVTAQATRMLADGRSKIVLAEFHRQWLELPKIDTIEKDLTVIQGFTSDLRPLMRQETESFIDAIASSDKADFPSLLTAPFSFMNAKLAAFYGVKGPTGDAFQRVDLDPSKYAGILTQGGLLALHAHANQTSPVHRGLFVRRQLLCASPPPPPANVVIDLPKLDANLTTRQRFSQHATTAFCSACHKMMDPIGLGFEGFDPVGRLRATENGLPVDVSGELVSTDVDGKFAGPVELAGKLAVSQQVEDCAVTQWFRFGYGREDAGDADACNRAVLSKRFADSGHDVRELFLALTQTDAFMYRSVAEGESP